MFGNTLCVGLVFYRRTHKVVDIHLNEKKYHVGNYFIEIFLGQNRILSETIGYYTSGIKIRRFYLQSNSYSDDF